MADPPGPAPSPWSDPSPCTTSPTGNMAAPSMVTRDGDNLVVRSVVSGDALFGTEDKPDENSLVPPPEEPPSEEFLPQTRVKRNYSCSTCEFTTQNPRNFLYHLRDDHKQKFKIYECPRCLYASRHSQKLHRHMHMVHVLGAIKRKPSARLRRIKPRPPPRPLEPPKPPPLPTDTEFTLSEDGTTIIYKCSVCDFQTKSQTVLVKHERVLHLKKKFFRCNKCDYITHIRARYTKHVKYHSMPMIKCDICDFRTPYKWNLERHNKNHQGDGAFKCYMCNFTADIKQSLTVHEMNHHTSGPLGTSRRRYKVGASDMLPHDDQLDIVHFESREANHLSKAERIAARKLQLKMRNREREQFDLMGTPVEIPMDGRIRVKCRTCQFSHESLEEVRAHEALAHGQKEKKKPPRPIPNLIPIGPPPTKKQQPPLTDKDMNEICVKSAKTSSLKDFASLIGDDNAFTGEEFRLPHKQTSLLRMTPDTRSSSPDSVDSKKETTIKKKSSSFFNKLQEKLMTGATETDLLCSICGYQAKCLSELVKHKESLHPEEEALESSTCQSCGLVCGTLAALSEHSLSCKPSPSPPLHLNGTSQSLTREVTITKSQERKEFLRSEYETPTKEEPHEDEDVTPDKHPMENKVFVWNTFLTQGPDQPEEAPLIHEKLEDPTIYLGTEIKPGYGTAAPMGPEESESTAKSGLFMRKAYKCPHCDFWASTASRFHVHIVGHLNKRPFRCSLCQYSSNWRWDITKHIRLKAFRGPEHQGARVLLTDEAGMRDYVKYSKYLALIKVDSSPQAQSPLKPRRILPRLNTSSPGGTPVKRNLSPALGDQQPHKKTRLYNTKKMWKCKKCQYRNSDRQVVLAHVRSHYYPDGQKSLDKNRNDDGRMSPLAPPCSDSEKSERTKLGNHSNSDSENDENDECPDFMCETCPFVADSMKTLEEHAEKHFVTHGTNHKCKSCPYYASTQEDLNEHCQLHENIVSEDALETKNVIYACLKCPYFGRKKSQLTYHRKWHGKSEEGKHACPKTKCNYTAPNNTILALHVRLHRHTLPDNVEGKKLIPPKPSPSIPISSYADISGVDTSKLSEIPLAWVCKGSRISKMFKCRYCPHVNIRKPNIQEHEKMHSDRSPGKAGFGSQHRCNLCNYICNNAGVLSSHAKVHQAFYGTVCAIADPSRSDEEQIEEVKQKMIQDETSDLKGDAVVGQTSAEVKPGAEKLIHFCSICPARFLYPKELMIHSRFHVLKLPFRCETCTYTARQRQHLFIHKKVHTNDYHERTKILLMSYSESSENPRPHLSNSSDDNSSLWIVAKDEPHEKDSIFKCSKCPEKFSNKEAFDRHFGFHGWPGKFKCKFCDYTVLLFDDLIQHELLHIEETYDPVPLQIDIKSKKKEEQELKQKTFIDPEFGSQVQGSPDFIYPTIMRNGKKKEKRYKCHKCPSAFEKREQYKIHMSLHGSKQRYNCDRCDYSVKYYANYIQHVKKHNYNEQGKEDKSPSEGNITDELISEDNSEDVKNFDQPAMEEKAKKYMNMCVADEQTLEFIKQREATNRFSTEPIHRCPLCPYTNNRRDAVMSHLKCHSAVRGKCYTCKYCDYRVPQSRFFKEHIRTHFLPMKYIRPDSYMKINQLEIWAEPVDQNDNMDKFLVFKDSGDRCDISDRFLPKVKISRPPQTPNPKGRVYINLKTGEEEIELDDNEEEKVDNEPEDVSNSETEIKQEEPFVTEGNVDEEMSNCENESKEPTFTGPDHREETSNKTYDMTDEISNCESEVKQEQEDNSMVISNELDAIENPTVSNDVEMTSVRENGEESQHSRPAASVCSDTDDSSSSSSSSSTSSSSCSSSLQTNPSQD